MKLIFKQLFLPIIIFLTTSLTTYAGGPPPPTTYNSQSTSGNWKTNAKWDQGAWPANNQTNGSHVINITNDHKITLTDVLSVKSGTVINVTTDDTLEIIGNVTFSNGSVVNVNTGGVLKIAGDVTNNNNSNTITIDGLIDITGDFTGGNGSEINGTGSMDITGTITTNGSATIFGSTADCNTPGSCSPSAPPPLPISLLNFEAEVNDDYVNLKWITSSETNNAYFTVERSSDAENWEEIISTTGAGNSNQILSYLEADFQPLKGISYYRLKQTDFDGKFEYFNIIPVKYNISTEDDDLSIFPNPVQQGENISINHNFNPTDEVLVVLRDMQGKQFYSKVLININKNELIGVPIDYEIPTGIYFITATSENKIHSKKIIIK